MCLRIVYKDKKSSFEHLQMQPPEVVYVKRCLKNFAKFTGKHLCQSLFFNKVAGLRSEFCEISKTIFFYLHLWWQLLKITVLQN